MSKEIRVLLVCAAALGAAACSTPSERVGGAVGGAVVGGAVAGPVGAVVGGVGGAVVGPSVAHAVGVPHHRYRHCWWRNGRRYCR